MNLDSLREHCLSLPGATENIQWGAGLVFKIGGKMFTVASTEPGETRVSFKCTPDEFAELVEQEASSRRITSRVTTGSRCCAGTRRPTARSVG
jgi:predicted DNA-binding protein (MmcQ/YjbR family)